MNKYEVAIEYFFSVMERGDIKNDKEQDMFEIAIEALNKVKRSATDEKIVVMKEKEIDDTLKELGEKICTKIGKRFIDNPSDTVEIDGIIYNLECLEELPWETEYDGSMDIGWIIFQVETKNKGRLDLFLRQEMYDHYNNNFECSEPEVVIKKNGEWISYDL